MKSLIEIEELCFAYPNASNQALQDVNFQIKSGEFVGITGPAGAGKSTLVLCLNGIIPHFQRGSYCGRVLIDGQDTFDSSCAQLAKKVGSVFQDPEAQLVAPLVEDEIAFGLENFAFAPQLMEKRIKETLEIIGISQLRHRATTELSGGQKQRVAIAAAVALRPEILILDEPTSELDPLGTIEVFEVLRHLNQEYGLTIIVVEQKLQLLMEYVQRLLVFNQGNLEEDLTPRELVNKPEVFKRVGLREPPVTELARRLQEVGIYQGEIPLTVTEAYQGLTRSLGGKG